MESYIQASQAAIPKDVRDYGLSECHIRPLAAFGEFKRGRRVDPALAWESATRLQINPENATAALAFDVDNPKTMLPLWRWIEVLNEDLSMEDWQIIDGYRVNTDRYPHALLPSWIVRNESTGRFHAVYILKLPVHRNPSSSSSPQHFLDYIRRGIALTWHADLNYNGILTLNPVKPPDRLYDHLVSTRAVHTPRAGAVPTTRAASEFLNPGRRLAQLPDLGSGQARGIPTRERTPHHRGRQLARHRRQTQSDGIL